MDAIGRIGIQAYSEDTHHSVLLVGAYGRYSEVVSIGGNLTG